VLGVKQTKPACSKFEINPVCCGLKYAKGAIVTPLGNIEVEWKAKNNIIDLSVRHPSKIKIKIRDSKKLRVSDRIY